MFPGGNAVNVAALAQRYGHQASYLGWLGQDDHGRLIFEALREEGVDLSHCRMVEGPNAYCEVTLSEGERVFGAYSEGVRDQIELTGADLAFIRGHEVCHTSIYSFLERQLEALAGAARHLSFDFSSDWTRAYLAATLPWVDLALLSSGEESRRELEALVAWVTAQGPSMVVVTQGSRGAYASDGERLWHQPVVEAEVVDTLGAGDAFAARFLVEYVGGEDVELALARAAAEAAEACSHYGAFGHGVEIPGRAEEGALSALESGAPAAEESN
jgi:fructoselysine 6-kinase